MEGVQFGLSTSSTHDGNDPRIATVGIMGIGPEHSETRALSQNTTSHPNIVSDLKAHGVIRTRAFSLYVNSIGKTSSILDTT